MLFRLVPVLLALLVSGVSLAKPLPEDQVPDPLKPWIEWVKENNPELNCPVSFSDESRACVWPGELQINATTSGATFIQYVRVFTETRLVLPGDRKHWPMNVTVDSLPAEVTSVNQTPAVRLQPGSYQISGRFKWNRLPGTLGIDKRIGIVRFSLDGQLIDQPQIRGNRLWIAENRNAENKKTPQDALNLQVFRQLSDGHPFQVETHLRLEVSGAQREVVLHGLLLDGFLPLSLQSRLPARLESGGKLRVQLRPGSHQLTLTSRHTGSVAQITAPAVSKPWPEQEVWVFRSAPSDRVVELAGLNQIDPRNVNLPKEWSSLPAYQAPAGDTLTIEQVRRGDPVPPPDQLGLTRKLWLDFDGAGYTMRDNIRGEMNSDWRISADEAIVPGRILINGKPQFITTLPDDPKTGVEVRRGRLTMVAESRYEGSISEIPAAGWGRDLQSLQTSLRLPPGWQLVAAVGPDSANGSWLTKWTLFDLFLVLIISIAVGKLWGWLWVPVSLAALALVWHEPGAPGVIWLALLASIALLRVISNAGYLSMALRAIRLALLLILVVTLVPFIATQARLALYPQLESSRSVAYPSSEPLMAEQESTMAQDARVQSRPSPSMKSKRGRFEQAPAPAPQRKSWQSKKLNQIDPDARIQTGPGLPSWDSHRVELRFDGPVTNGQTIKLYLVPPWLTRALRVLAIALLLLLAWRMLDMRKPPKGTRRGIGALVVAALTAYAPTAASAEFPPPEMLKELEQRLAQQPVAAPRAGIQSMLLRVDESTYEAKLNVHVLQWSAVPLPVDTKTAEPVSVTIDGVFVGDRLYRANNQLWLLVPKGRHAIELKAYLPPRDQLQIPLPLRPARVESDLTDWAIEGVDANGVPAQVINLIRTSKDTATAQTKLTPRTLPGFVRINRVLRFGIDWEVHTTVKRESPRGSGLSVSVPLLDGESVVSASTRVVNGAVQVSLGPSQSSVSWKSRLEPVEKLNITAPDNSAWLETWRLDVGPIWHVKTEGLAPVHHQDEARNWLPTWHPWPGESIALTVTRPLGTDGRTSTINSSELIVKPGNRATDLTLLFSLISSQGGQHKFALPPNVKLQKVQVNGRSQPIRQEGDQVVLPVVPGKNDFQVQWRDPTGITTQWQTPSFQLADAHVNATTKVQWPRDRWTLWTTGPLMGPAILFWGILAVVLVASFVLAFGLKGLPLGLVSWFLLGVGLSQVWVLAALIVVAWFVLLRYRSTLGVHTSVWTFNTIQVVIVIVTLMTIAVLFGAVQAGLLGYPNMQITGNGSNGWRYIWYQDRVDGAYPQGSVFSVPLLYYRIAMLAWALWLAFSLLKWLRWGWQSFSSGGLWRAIKFAKPSDSVLAR